MRIQCSLVVFTLEFDLGRCELNVHWTNPPLEVDWNRTGNEFIVYSLNNNKTTHSYAPTNSNIVKVFASRPPYTHCICHPRYKLWWSIMLRCYWLDAAENETTISKWFCAVPRNSHSTSSTTSKKISQIIIEPTLVCVSECWLNKARMEIVTWATMGVARQQQFSYNFGSGNTIDVDSIRI